MTPQEHNKYLAYSHLAYGALTLLFAMAFLVMFGAMIFTIPDPPDGRGSPPPPAFFFIFLTFIGLIYFAFTIPSFIAGYALLKRKRWARTASIIAGVIAAMFFPIGTAVCVYTVWFLMSEPGKLLYDTPTTPLPPFGQGSSGQGELQQDSSVTPPDWR